MPATLKTRRPLLLQVRRCRPGSSSLLKHGLACAHPCWPTSEGESREDDGCLPHGGARSTRLRWEAQACVTRQLDRSRTTQQAHTDTASDGDADSAQPRSSRGTTPSTGRIRSPSAERCGRSCARTVCDAGATPRLASSPPACSCSPPWPCRASSDSAIPSSAAKPWSTR